MKVDIGDPSEFRAQLTDALHERAYVIYYQDDSWGVPALPEALRIADFVMDLLLNGDDPDED